MDFLLHHIEALIFCSPEPVKKTEIKNCLVEMFDAEIPDEDIGHCTGQTGGEVST